MSEIVEMKSELKAKLIEITLLEQERDHAQRQVIRQRSQYRKELMQLPEEDAIENQLDPRNVDGLSSEVGRLESLTLSDGGFGTEADSESDYGGAHHTRAEVGSTQDFR